MNKTISVSEWLKKNWYIVAVIVIVVSTAAYVYAVFTTPIPYPSVP